MNNWLGVNGLLEVRDMILWLLGVSLTSEFFPKMTMSQHKETLYLHRNYKENMHFHSISATKLRIKIENDKKIGKN